MAITTRKNLSVKAIQSVMAKDKKHSARALLEWEIACNTNVNRGKVYAQEELFSLYARDSFKCKHGASKTCHLESHEGKEFKYIVVKRHKTHGYIPFVGNEHDKCTGNQLLDEINCWLEFAETPESDLLCPILKYFTSKSDKVSATSKTMLHNIIIIAQKAVYVDDAIGACHKAEELNSANGYHGKDAHTRYEELKALSKKQGWRDAMRNPGNSGVIFDYNLGCYKAVFIDYAL